MFCVVLLQLSLQSQGLSLTSVDWRTSAALHWTKTLYLLLAFPFLLFKLPVLGKLLTHTRPTGYNPRGNVVPTKIGDKFAHGGQVQSV